MPRTKNDVSREIEIANQFLSNLHDDRAKPQSVRDRAKTDKLIAEWRVELRRLLAELQDLFYTVEKQRIGHHLYLRCGSHVVQVKGPYRPGSVWMATLYQTLPGFDEAWAARAMTVVERKRASEEWNFIVAAMMFGDSAAIDPDIAKEVRCLGYQHKTQKAAIERAMSEFATLSK